MQIVLRRSRMDKSSGYKDIFNIQVSYILKYVRDSVDVLVWLSYKQRVKMCVLPHITWG